MDNKTCARCFRFIVHRRPSMIFSSVIIEPVMIIITISSQECHRFHFHFHSQYCVKWIITGSSTGWEMVVVLLSYYDHLKSPKTSSSSLFKTQDESQGSTGCQADALAFDRKLPFILRHVFDIFWRRWWWWDNYDATMMIMKWLLCDYEENTKILWSVIPLYPAQRSWHILMTRSRWFG